jgi:hypothetical protein
MRERERGMYDVLPSRGVSSAMQQALDQYCTKTVGPVRMSVLQFQFERSVFKDCSKWHVEVTVTSGL